MRGFSLGGMVAQQMALDRPSVFRKMILVGTAPRGGEDCTSKSQASPGISPIRNFWVCSPAKAGAFRANADGHHNAAPFAPIMADAAPLRKTTDDLTGELISHWERRSSRPVETAIATATDLPDGSS